MSAGGFLILVGAIVFIGSIAENFIRGLTNGILFWNSLPEMFLGMILIAVGGGLSLRGSSQEDDQ
jgi:hypothetical protein